MDLDTLMAQSDPARHAELPGPDSAEAARLYHQITARTPRRRRLVRGGLVVGAGLTAVVATLVTLVALTSSSGPGGTGSGRTGSGRTGHASATAILDAAAVAAGHGAGASRPPGPGQYLYVQEIDVKGLSNKPTLSCPEAPIERQAWVAANGSGRQTGTFPARCARWDFSQTVTRGGMPWQLYGVVQAGSFPTRPAALERAIVTRFENGKSRPSATFVYAETFLNAGSSAALREALYKVIESLPGVQNLGPATDRLGRHGQAVGLVTSGTREVLIFDPATTVVLEREMVAVPPEQSGNNMLPAGTVLQYTVYMREGVVNSDTAIPSPGAGTASPSPGAGTASPSSTAVG